MKQLLVDLVPIVVVGALGGGAGYLAAKAPAEVFISAPPEHVNPGAIAWEREQARLKNAKGASGGQAR